MEGGEGTTLVVNWDLRDEYDNGKVTNVTGGVSGDKCEHMLTGERQL